MVEKFVTLWSKKTNKVEQIHTAVYAGTYKDGVGVMGDDGNRVIYEEVFLSKSEMEHYLLDFNFSDYNNKRLDKVGYSDEEDFDFTPPG